MGRNFPINQSTNQPITSRSVAPSRTVTQASRVGEVLPAPPLAHSPLHQKKERQVDRGYMLNMRGWFPRKGGGAAKGLALHDVRSPTQSQSGWWLHQGTQLVRGAQKPASGADQRCSELPPKDGQQPRPATPVGQAESLRSTLELLLKASAATPSRLELRLASAEWFIPSARRCKLNSGALVIPPSFPHPMKQGVKLTQLPFPDILTTNPGHGRDRIIPIPETGLFWLFVLVFCLF